MHRGVARAVGLKERGRAVQQAGDTQQAGEESAPPLWV